MKLTRLLQQHLRQGKSKIRKIIASGQVTVQGKIITDAQYLINKFDHVALRDHTLQSRAAIYLMLHKPAGYLSATTDSQHPTVIELINEKETLHIAGRLDRASTGLLILTNDGKWSRHLTEPTEKIPKTYLLTTAAPITPETSILFQKGIYFAYEDLTTSPAELQLIDSTTARLTIYEGRYHQIKRMFHAIGNRVTSLHREKIGSITLDPLLQPGQSRLLHKEEIESSNHL